MRYLRTFLVMSVAVLVVLLATTLIQPRSAKAENGHPSIILNGVHVDLWEDTNASGIFGDGDSTPRSYTTTDIPYYQGTNAPLTLPGSWEFSWPPQGGRGGPYGFVIGPLPYRPTAFDLTIAIFPDQSPLLHSLVGLPVTLWNDLDNDGVFGSQGDTLFRQTQATGLLGDALFQYVSLGTSMAPVGAVVDVSTVSTAHTILGGQIYGQSAGQGR